MSAQLPGWLRSAIDTLLEGQSRTAIAERAAALSAHYRAGRGSDEGVTTETDILAYLLARMPATYAALAVALREVASRAPDFAPQTLLDVGAGPGTASFAAAEIFPDLATIRMLDCNAHFGAMAERLARQSGHAGLASATTQTIDATRGAALPSADLVVAGYVLAELRGDAVAAFAAKLWAACSGVLAIVEPGTPDGYARILAARERLLGEGAQLLAPCPHHLACPIVPPDWCHFSVRLPRSRDHLIAKAAHVPFEDEKFSYLVVAREGVVRAPYDARVLAPPFRNKVGVTLKLCTQGRIEQRVVGKRDREAFNAVRRIDWGDGV